jgi:hypothetical protein
MTDQNTNTDDSDEQPEFRSLPSDLNTKGGVGVSVNGIHIEINEDATNVFGLIKRWIGDIKGGESLPGQQTGYLLTEITLSYTEKNTVSVHSVEENLNGVGIHIDLDIQNRSATVTHPETETGYEYTFEDIRSRREYTQKVIDEGTTVTYRAQSGKVKTSEVTNTLQNAVTLRKETHPIPYANVIELE